MRLLLSALFVLIFGTANFAQDLTWTTDLAEAKAIAAEKQADILMVFAGSDWCRPCIQLKQNVLENAAFTTAMADELVVLYLDFPARKKNQLSKEETLRNEALAERYNRLGAFPKLVLLNTEEEILAQPEYKAQSVTDFIALLADRE